MAWTKFPCVASSSLASRVGTEFHSYVEAALLGLPLPTVSREALNMRPTDAANWVLDDLVATHEPDVFRAEIKLAACANYARILNSTEPRDYSSAPDGWIAGTADLVLVNFSSREAWIIDWKTTSSHTGISQSAGKASDNAQLLWLAHAIAILYRVDTIRVGLIHVGPTGTRIQDWYEYSRFELELAAAELWSIVSTADPTPKPGPHCYALYCPAVASCPAHAAIVRTSGLADGSFPIPKSIEEITNDQHALWIYARAKAVESAAARLRGIAEDYARVHGGASHDNYRLVVGKGQREAIKGNNVGRLCEILDKYAPGFASRIAHASVTKTELSEAIKASCAKGAFASTLRNCEEELRAAGYLQRTEYETVALKEEK